MDFMVPLVVSQCGRWHHYRRVCIVRSDTKMEARTSQGPSSLFVAPSFVGAIWGLRKTIIIPSRSSASNDLITSHQSPSLKGLTSSQCDSV